MAAPAHRPRVVHVVRQFWPLRGGMEESVRQLTRELAHHSDADVSVVTLDRAFADGTEFPAVDSIDGVSVRRIPYRGSYRYPIAPSVFAETAHADLIHVHGIDFLFDAMAAARSVRNVPLVASTHGGFFHTAFASRLKQVWFNTLTRASVRAYDCIGASSVGDAERFRTIADGRVELIENGVDIDKWADASSQDAPPVLIAIGRWSSNKNLEAAFALLAALRRRDPAWRLIVAGEPYDRHRADLDGWVAKHDVADAVEIHQGPTTEALAGLIGRSTYLLSTSDYEGFGLTVVEGLSAGLVPVLSDILNYRLFVERAGVGLIYDTAAPAAGADALSVLHARMQGERAAQRSRAITGAAGYSWPGVAARWAAVYDRALGRG